MERRIFCNMKLVTISVETTFQPMSKVDIFDFCVFIGCNIYTDMTHMVVRFSHHAISSTNISQVIATYISFHFSIYNLIISSCSNRRLIIMNILMNRHSYRSVLLINKSVITCCCWTTSYLRMKCPMHYDWFNFT